MIRRSRATRRRPAKPVFDAHSNSNGNGTRSWTHPASSISGLTTRTVFATLTCLNRGASAPVAKCGGVTMNLIGTREPGSNEGFLAFYRLDNVPAAAVAMVIETGDPYTTGMAMSYTPAPNIAGVSSAGGISTTASTGQVPVATASELLVCAAFMKNQPTVTSGVTRGAADHGSGYLRTRFVEGSGVSPQTITLTQEGQTFALIWARISG